MQHQAANHQIHAFLEDIYMRYKIPLLKAIYRHIGDLDACEDVFQEVLVRIIRNSEMLYSFSKPQLEAYIYLIAKGVSIDYLRKQSRKMQVAISNDSLLAHLAENQRHALDSLDAFEKVDLSLMIAKLSAEDQILLVGKYYLGLSVHELISLVGGTSSSVRNKLFKARKKVYIEWTNSGLSMEDFFNE